MQKDKEAAVLKANHKYEILLNIELERIEKCKRTYESFHNFEVAVMNKRRNRILQKQCELKATKLGKDITDLQRDAGVTCDPRSLSNVRAVVQNLPSNNTTNTRCILDPVKRIPVSTIVTHSSTHFIPAQHRLPERNSSSSVATIARNALYANNVPTRRGNVPCLTQLLGKANSGRDHSQASAHMARTSSIEEPAKLPLLHSLSPPKSPTTTPCTTSTSHRHAHFPESLPEARVMYSRSDSRGVRMPSTVPRSGKKKQHRASTGDHLTPFDQYRLQLQESEQRIRRPKSKHHFTRAISAMETFGCRKVDDTLMQLRRARSADIQ